MSTANVLEATALLATAAQNAHRRGLPLDATRRGQMREAMRLVARLAADPAAWQFGKQDAAPLLETITDPASPEADATQALQGLYDQLRWHDVISAEEARIMRDAATSWQAAERRVWGRG